MSILKRIKGLFKKKSELKYLEEHGFQHGSNFYMYGNCIDSNWPWLITVGDNVTLASDCKLLAHDASTNKVGCHTKIGRVDVGNNVFVGAYSVVLCNTKIGDNVVIGANSVVTHDLESNGVYAGNPARFVCSIEDYKKKHEKALETHKLFDEMRWDEWINASPEMWNKMKDELKDDFGYV